MDQNKLDGFRQAFETEGLEAGLKYLNSLVQHRFTALYRLSNGLLTNIVLIDKQGEATPEALREIPLEDSLCQFAVREGEFKTVNSNADHRLDGHAFQGVVLAYHGVPVMDSQGVLFGTLCHLNEEKCGLSEEGFELLQYAASLIGAGLTD